MKILTAISRILVGGLFIFSGLIKLNDPLGFAYKLEDYFAHDVLNLPFLDPYTLQMSLFIVVLEVLLGVALLLGFKQRPVLVLLLIMIVFFTFLTFYSAYFNKVTDCGCFGDAIPLTPWQSFYKDLVLLVLIVFLWMRRNSLGWKLPSRSSGGLMAFSLIFCIWLGYFVLNHLPLMDFRPYAEGKSIREGLKSAEELGKQPPEYRTFYTLVNKETGEEKRMGSDVYVEEGYWKDENWEMDSDKTESRLVKEGYEPPIHDFNIDLGGEDITDSILSMNRIFLVVSYKMDIASERGHEAVAEFARQAQEDGETVLGLTASSYETVEEWRHELQIPYPFGNTDETALKTIIRANPGILLLEEGVVKTKWHYNDLPSYEDWKSEKN